jgi:hypothetical protein
MKSAQKQLLGKVVNLITKKVNYVLVKKKIVYPGFRLQTFTSHTNVSGLPSST